MAEVNRAYVILRDIQVELDRARSECSALELEIADSNLFISNLELKLSQLTDARAAVEDFVVGKFSTLEQPTLDMENTGDVRLGDHAKIWGFVKIWLGTNVHGIPAVDDIETMPSEVDRLRAKLLNDALEDNFDRVALEGALGNIDDVISEYYRSIYDPDSGFR